MKFPHSFFALILSCFCFYNLLGQNSAADSLMQELAKHERGKTGPNAAKRSLNDSVTVNILNELALLHLRADPEKAIQHATRGLKLASEINFTHGQFVLNNSLAKIYEAGEDYTRAMKFYKTSLNFIDDEAAADKAAVYTSIGNIHGRLLDYPQALEFMLLGLKFAKQSQDKFQTARVYNNIGVMNKFQKRPDEALRNFSKALEIMKQVGNQPAIGMLYQNIGDMYCVLGQFDLSISHHSKAIEIGKLVNDTKLLSMSYNGLGLAFTEKRLYDKALQNLNAALQINQSVGFKEGIAKSYINMGRAYFMKGDMEHALKSAEKGLALAKEGRQFPLQMNGYELFSKIYEQKKDYRKALDNERLFQNLQDSIFSLESEQAVSKLKVRYDFKAAQDSLQAIQAKKDILAKAELISSRNSRNFILTIFAIAIIFLITLLWQRNKIASVKRQKALETERNRISRDLHDNLGAQLSTVRMFVSSLKSGNGSANAQIIDNSIGLLDTSIGELRGIMHEMHHPVLIEKGLLNATEELINKVNQLHSVRFSLSSHGMEDRPSPGLEHQLYRITQELVNNTLKYANAKNVSIDILRRDDCIVLMYEDDGKGFDPATVKKGYGLANIETRAKSVGGSVTFDSAPKAGATTIVEIPEK